MVKTVIIRIFFDKKYFGRYIKGTIYFNTLPANNGIVF